MECDKMNPLMSTVTKEAVSKSLDNNVIFPHINSLWPSDAIWWQIWINVGPGNGLLPDGTKPLMTWTNVDLSSVRYCGIDLISQEMLKISILDMSLKFTTVKPLI